jgi:hypothetical protein
MRDVRREREPLPSGEEVLWAAMAELVESGAAALRERTARGLCAYGSCLRPPMDVSPFCRKHDVGGAP